MSVVARHDWGSVICYEGDVLDCLAEMPAESVHCVVTSPPYWALRSYLKPDDPLKPLEIGSEKTPDEYVAKLVEVFRAVRMVLREDGLMWVNLGDSYSGSGRGGNPEDSFHRGNVSIGTVDACAAAGGGKVVPPGLKPLDLCNIPHRVAAALQADGWWWRDTIIWAKPSPMPASLNGSRFERCRVKAGKIKGGGKQSTSPGAFTAMNGGTDIAVWSDCPGCPKCSANGGYVLRRGSWRTTTAHEYIFMFAKSASYFADAQAVKEECAPASIERMRAGFNPTERDDENSYGDNYQRGDGYECLTRNPRSVWTIGPEPLSIAHYASFPTELPRRCIEASTSVKGCCPKCKACWARVVECRAGTDRPNSRPIGARGVQPSLCASEGQPQNGGRFVEQTTLGFRPTCACPGDLQPVPCVVLDPFGGTGTTALAALRIGRKAVLIELNPAYVELARQRIYDEMPLMMLAGSTP